MLTVPPPPPLPPEAESIRSLTKVAGLITLIYGIIEIILGIVLLLFLIGIVPLISGIVDILIYTNCNDIIRTIERGDYVKAKEKTLTWMIIGFIIGGLLPGILLLLAYMKYDELLRRTGSY
jgi:hypothetical protein